MRIKVRCTLCGWMLRVDPHFAGGRCRCHHCGGVTDVPADRAVPKLPRPQKPRLRMPSVRVAHSHRVLWFHRFRRMPAMAVAAVLLLAAGVLSWRFVRLGGDAVVTEPPVDVDPRSVARLPSAATLATLPCEFMGVRVTAPRVVWILDGAASMTPLYADVTSLVTITLATMDPRTQRYGVSLAGPAPVSVPLGPANSTSLDAARRLMKGFRPEGTSSISRAFDEVLTWNPSEVFLVTSEPADRNRIDAMVSAAVRSKVRVSVATVHEPNHNWQALARETGGYYGYHDREQLTRAVEQVFGADVLLSGARYAAPDAASLARANSGLQRSD